MALEPTDVDGNPIDLSEVESIDEFYVLRPSGKRARVETTTPGKVWRVGLLDDRNLQTSSPGQVERDGDGKYTPLQSRIGGLAEPLTPEPTLLDAIERLLQGD